MSYRKIKRGGGMFGRRKNYTWLKILCGVLCVAVLFYGGYYLGSALFGEEAEPSSLIEQSSNPPVEGSSLPDTDPPKTEKTRLVLHFCDVQTLLNADARSAFFQKAKEAGATGIVFPCKDESGNVYLKLTGEVLERSKAVVSSALDPAALAEELTDAGLVGIPMVYTFKDPLAAAKNPSLAIWYNNGIENYLWLDGYADKGGKPWLNPYKESTVSYLLSINQALYDAGFEQIILNGNLFGTTADNNSASFGQVSGSHLDAMTAFVQKCESQAAAADAVCWFAADAGELFDKNKNMNASFLQTNAKHIAPVFNLTTLPHNLTFGEKTIASAVEDPAGATKLLLEAYAAKSPGTAFLSIFADYQTVSKVQAESLEDDAPYLLLQAG
ncbi:MAG: hypothetical protein IJC85_07330 [Oscillospiraceae bacterium]|nr:hypothetical protein [Oscillospiraceae bacterium]